MKSILASLFYGFNNFVITGKPKKQTGNLPSCMKQTGKGFQERIPLFLKGVRDIDDTEPSPIGNHSNRVSEYVKGKFVVRKIR